MCNKTSFLNNLNLRVYSTLSGLTIFVCGGEVPTSYFDIAKGVIKMWGSFLKANIHIYINF